MQISRSNTCTGLLILAGILTALSIGGCGQEPAVEKQRVARNVIALRVADTTGLSQRAFPGRARAGQEVNLSFRVTGPLIAMPADVGDELKAGDLVARIDPSDYETAVRTVHSTIATLGDGMAVIKMFIRGENGCRVYQHPFIASMRAPLQEQQERAKKLIRDAGKRFHKKTRAEVERMVDGVMRRKI